MCNDPDDIEDDQAEDIWLMKTSEAIGTLMLSTQFSDAGNRINQDLEALEAAWDEYDCWVDRMRDKPCR